MSDKNHFLTPTEVGDEFRDAARRVVAKAPLQDVRKWAAIEQAMPGINGGIVAFLVLASRERLESLQKVET